MNLMKRAITGLSALTLAVSALPFNGALNAFADDAPAEIKVLDMLFRNEVVNNGSNFNVDYTRNGYADALDVQLMEDVINKYIYMNELPTKNSEIIRIYDQNNNKALDKQEIIALFDSNDDGLVNKLDDAHIFDYNRDLVVDELDFISVFDYNQDGVVNENDYIKAQKDMQSIFRIIKFNNDYNNDGIVNDLDLSILQDKINSYSTTNTPPTESQIYDYCNDNKLDKNDYENAYNDMIYFVDTEEKTVTIYGLKDDSPENKARIKNLVIPNKIFTQEAGSNYQAFFAVNTIHDNAFTEYNNLETLTIMDYTQPYVPAPDNSGTIIETAGQKTASMEISIKKDAFKKCAKLKNVYLPQNIKYLDNTAFLNTPFVNIKNGNLPISGDFIILKDSDASTQIAVKYIGNDSTVTIPDGVTVLKDNLFAENTQIKTLVLPTTLQCIGENAFEGCKNIESISGNNDIVSKYIAEFDETNFVAVETIKKIDACIADLKRTRYATTENTAYASNHYTAVEFDSLPEFYKAYLIGNYIKKTLNGGVYYRDYGYPNNGSVYFNKDYYILDLGRGSVYSPCAAFYNTSTECQGFATAYSLFLDRVGIKHCCAGSAGHAFDAVYCDGKWYKVDLTGTADLNLFGNTDFQQWTAKYNELDAFLNIAMPDGSTFSSTQTMNLNITLGDISALDEKFTDFFGENNGIVRDLISDINGDGVYNDIDKYIFELGDIDGDGKYGCNDYYCNIIGDYNNDKNINSSDLKAVNDLTYNAEYYEHDVNYKKTDGWYICGFKTSDTPTDVYFNGTYEIVKNAFSNRKQIENVYFLGVPKIGIYAFAGSGVQRINGSPMLVSANTDVIKANPTAFLGTPFYANNKEAYDKILADYNNGLLD